MTPSEAFAIMSYGIYDNVDILLTEKNLAFYEGEWEPGSLVGWVNLADCIDGENQQQI